MAKKSKKGSIVWLTGVTFLSVGLLMFCQFYFGDGISNKSTFYQGTKINGVDVSGMTRVEAQEVVSAKMLKEADEIDLTLKNGDKTWTLKGSDLDKKVDIDDSLMQVMSYGRNGNAFTKKKIAKKIKDDGINFNISYDKIFSNFDEKIDDLVSEIEKSGDFPKINFTPDEETMFTVNEDFKQIKVDKSILKSEISKALKSNLQAVVPIPITELTPSFDINGLINQIKLRSKFTTSYKTSSSDRKYNVKKALSSFNGMIVEPGQEVSFNKVTGARSIDNGYKTANIIVNGVYTAGAGGGVCQASTTLYNALLLSGVDILQVNHHSLPASYIPLSFDAMVSEGVSDLVFKNNLDFPIYIKTKCDDESATVEIYGKPFEEGEEIATRTELVNVIPHNGDKIIPDSNGEYSNHVLYKGEYYRLKYPREGYESKGYVIYKNGNEIKETLIRHDYYQPQEGVIVEGVEQLGSGMTLPPSEVKIIPAQKKMQNSNQNIKNKIEKSNPSEYNP